jgi:hypothetical protein
MLASRIFSGSIFQNELEALSELVSVAINNHKKNDRPEFMIDAIFNSYINIHDSRAIKYDD